MGYAEKATENLVTMLDDGTPANWTKAYFGPSDSEAVNDDDYGTYIREGTQGDDHVYPMHDVTLDWVSIDSVVIFPEMRRSAAYNSEVDVGVIVNSDSTTTAGIVLTDGWVVYQVDFPLAPDGGAWDTTEINDLEVWFQKGVTVGGAQCYLPEFHVTVYGDTGEVASGIPQYRHSNSDVGYRHDNSEVGVRHSQ